jgi:hypothetical protein
MKTLGLFTALFFLNVSLHAAAPRFYVAGQIGAYAADAGTPTAYGPYVDRGIKSGAEMFTDWSVGAEIRDWLSVEAGYVHFASFSSNVFEFRPGIIPARPEGRWQTYELGGLRLSSVVTVFASKRMACKLLGGIIHSTGTITRRDRFFALLERRVDMDNVGYQFGIAATYQLSKQAAVEARILRYDFGKVDNDPNRITALTYSLGLSWRF